MRFSTRDLFWLVALAAMGCGWWVERREYRARTAEAAQKAIQYEILEGFLKEQGWLEKPCCPMLIVNGKNDLQTPIADLYILLEYGAPKSARVFPGAHMGQTPQTFPTIVTWLKHELA